jgi:hypothetical protein
VAVAYGQRPSAILGIVDSLPAWAVDSAVETWGDFIEGKLAEVDKDGNHTWTPEELLGEWGTMAGQRYAPASELVTRFQQTGGRA